MKLILIVLIILSLSGCAWIRQTVLEASEEDIKNVEVVKQVGENTFLVWPCYSGFLQGVLGASLEESRIGLVVSKMDKLTKDVGKWSEPDFQSCHMAGLRGKFSEKAFEDIVKRVLELVAQYGPMVGL